MLQVKQEPALLTMPAELRVFTLQNCIAASPYNRSTSGSFYNTKDKSWSYTPEGAIRVSDHWNFYSQGETHCITDIDNSKLIGKWVVAQYNNGIWQVIAADEKDTTAYDLHYKRMYAKEQPLTVSEIRIKRERLLQQKRAERRKAARDKKIKAKTLWVLVNVNIWSGTGRKVRFAGTENILGKLIAESKTGSSFVIEKENGYRREIRKYNSYKELDRKPYKRKAGK